MLIDLHMHTNYSDGTLSPEALTEHAAANGLDMIAITDHDVVEAYEVAAAHIAAAALPLTLIPAVEFNTDSPNREVHILGYFIDTKSPAMQQEMEILQQARSERIEKIIFKLQALSYEITLPEVLEQAKYALSLGRPHVARVLVAKGYFTNSKQAFDELLGRGRPGYVPHVKLSIANAVDIIAQAGGISVLAHPGLIKDDDYVERLLTDYPIQGLEVYYPKHSIDQIQQYLRLAHKHQLLITGGSDFHGKKERYPSKLGLFAVHNKQIPEIIKYNAGRK